MSFLLSPDLFNVLPWSGVMNQGVKSLKFFTVYFNFLSRLSVTGLILHAQLDFLSTPWQWHWRSSSVPIGCPASASAPQRCPRPCSRWCPSPGPSVASAPPWSPWPCPGGGGSGMADVWNPMADQYNERVEHWNASIRRSNGDKSNLQSSVSCQERPDLGLELSHSKYLIVWNNHNIIPELLLPHIKGEVASTHAINWYQQLATAQLWLACAGVNIPELVGVSTDPH